MRYLVTAEEMRRYDANTIEKIGIPGMVLMERAALAAAECVLARIGDLKKTDPGILILAGTGNNGGDGLALARLLSERGAEPEVWIVGDEAKASAQWTEQKHILEHYRVILSGKPMREKYDVLVDALFGVGLSRPVEGRYAEAVRTFNELTGHKLALDVPSGIDSDTGKVLGCAVSADETVTFGFVKRGLCLFPGCEYAGKVELADVGITDKAFFGEKPKMFSLEAEDIPRILPKRQKDGNKGTFGKVLLVAGSRNMSGAAILAAKACYRAGAGMVKVLTDESNRVIVQEGIPEALFGTYEDKEKSLEWADVVVAGPGLSVTDEAARILNHIFGVQDKPMIVDADGLNLLAADEELTDKLAKRRGESILTPHIAELSRLTKIPVEQLKSGAWEYAEELAGRLHCTVVAKDARTFICAPGKPFCVNLTGNSGMATAGSGDVLAGILGGVFGQARTAGGFDIACVGAYVHGMAGDLAAAEKGAYGCMAGDLADAAAKVLQGVMTKEGTDDFERKDSDSLGV